MARTVNEVKLTLFMLASDYNPAHYNWTKNELSALGDCKAIAEVIKKRLEDNGAKVKEMYAIEHKDKKKADSKSKECHNSTNTIKPKYHILVKFEPSHGTPLKEIAEYIGVPPEVIEKAKQGRYSYDDMLAYLTHIKNESKTPYAPEDVITLAGSDYMDYYNERKERWIKAREIVAKKGGKTLDRLFREAVAKIEKGEISYDDLCDIEEYDRLRLEPTYRKKLESKNACVVEKASEDYRRLLKKISNNEIASLEEITANKKWKLAYMYHQGNIENALQNQKAALIKQNCDTLCSQIANKEITSMDEIRTNEYWNLFSESQKKLIGVYCRNNGIPFER